MAYALTQQETQTCCGARSTDVELLALPVIVPEACKTACKHPQIGLERSKVACKEASGLRQLQDGR